MSRLAELGAKTKAEQSAKAESQRAAVREAMPPDMAEFLDEWKECDPEAKLTFLQTPTLTLGKEGDRGFPVEDMIFLGKEKKKVI